MMQHIFFILTLSTALFQNCKAGPHPLGSSDKNGFNKSDAAFNFIPVIPKECTNSTYCTIKSVNYPQEYIDNYLNSHTVVQLMEDDYLEIYGRSSDPTERALCQATSAEVNMQEVQTVNGEWYYAIQSERQNYTQVLKLEVCSHHHHPGKGDHQQSCESIATLNSNEKAICKQQFTYRSIMVLDEDGGFFVQLVKVPTCCLCAYEMDDE